MNLFKSVLMITSLVLSWQFSVFGDDGVSDKEITSCVSSIKSVCGQTDYKSCMKSKSDKAIEINGCVNKLISANQKKTIPLEGIGSSFKDLISGSAMTGDQKKCFDISTKVCGPNEDLKKCMKLHAGNFPSYCKEAALQGMDSLNQVYQNDREAKGCTDGLMKVCKLELPEATVKPDPRVYQAALSSYQNCLKSQVSKRKECSNLIDAKSGDGPATQLIK